MALGSPLAADAFNLKGRVALITGASSGLGERFAEVASANGASVVLTARREDRMQEIVARIEKAGGKAARFACDATDNASMAKAFDFAEKTFGTVDLFVANAGMARLGKVIEMPEDEYRKLMALDMDAVFFNSREAAKRMIAANKPGAIITTASIAAFIVERNIVAYNMAKAAVVLDDKYDFCSKAAEKLFLTGTQAASRSCACCLMQRERDRRAGLDTAGFVSGYRGSPLGGLDQQALARPPSSFPLSDASFSSRASTRISPRPPAGARSRPSCAAKASSMACSASGTARGRASTAPATCSATPTWPAPRRTAACSRSWATTTRRILHQRASVGVPLRRRDDADPEPGGRAGDHRLRPLRLRHVALRRHLGRRSNA
jgi:hypothetical protein